MTRPHEQGLLLLPVALVLAIAGAAAYTATREGGMSAAAVDARYEIEAARYLAEAGVNLVVWQNARRNCLAPVFSALEMGGGTIAVEGAVSKVPVTATSGGTGGGRNTTSVSGSGLAFTTVASFRGAVFRIERSGPSMKPFYDMNTRTVASVKAGDGADTFIGQGITTSNDARPYLEVSDAANANAHGLIKFVPPAVPFGTRLIAADLELTLESILVAGLPRSLSVHRVTRDWPDSATWTSPWSTAGGDHVATAASALAIGAVGARYAFPILELAEDWIKNPSLNHGVLLKPVGMTTARFAASDGNANRPFLVATYHPACS